MKINIECQCPFCGKIYEVKGVDSKDYLDWQFGKDAVDAFPYLTSEECESLISQVCPDCWNSIPKDEEEEGEENDY